MKQTVSLNDFREAFRNADRRENFTYEGQEVLFDYLEEMEQECGTELELDAIALCCEYNEDYPCDIAVNYSIDLPEDADTDEVLAVVRNYLDCETTVCGITSIGTIVYQIF